MTRSGSRLALSAVTLLAACALARSASADATSGVSKVVVSKSATGLNLGGAGEHVTFDLLKGVRKKRLLVVHASAHQSSGGSSQSLSLGVTANGVSLEPGFVTQNCPNSNCGVSATFFLDLDQAEAANPGAFSSVSPISIDTHGVSTAAGVSGKMAVTAELLKK